VSARPTTRRTAVDAPPAPSGVLFFVHGANETSDGLTRNLQRIETQLHARDWDVRVVGPEWRRRSGLRLGNWRKALPRAALPTTTRAAAIPRLAAGLRRDVVLKLVTAYFEPRREALIETLGAQLLADVIGYHQHRSSIQAVLREELEATVAGAGGRPVLPVGLSLGGVALVDLLASWPDAPVEACVTVGSQAPLLYAFDAIPSMPYDEREPPYLAMPWLNVYDTRDFLSFVAEPSFRRTDGLASVVDLRVRTGKDFPASHSAYWEQSAVWDAIATAFGWRRAERMTVREARLQGFEARKAPVRRTASD
jgi:hypothetical protein